MKKNIGLLTFIAGIAYLLYEYFKDNSTQVVTSVVGTGYSTDTESINSSLLKTASLIDTTNKDLLLQIQSLKDDFNAKINQQIKVVKFTAEIDLPLKGDLNTVYFLNVGGVKYLKKWDGMQYVNTSLNTDLPNCYHSLKYDYYAKFADISISNYTGRIASIIVIEDETQENKNGFYVFNGTSLVWILTQ